MSTFDPAQHPREATGQFAEKANTAPGKGLSVFEQRRADEEKAAAQIRETAKRLLPDAVKLVFETNYTDEGSSLTFSGTYDAAGSFTVIDQYDGEDLTDDQREAAELIDDEVFAQSGAGNDGSQIPGMRLRDGAVDVYLFDLGE